MKKNKTSSRDELLIELAGQLAEGTAQQLGQPIPKRLQVLLARLQEKSITTDQFKMLVSDWADEGNDEL
ncbi:MAG: hypothetical protein EOO61_05990 [Hymenobacter sp.]|nr:MAG: hypothetical protein EOO61_05990 [Hymenobacter sp.]